LSEDDVEVCQGVPDEFSTGDSGRGDGDDHTDQGSDKLGSCQTCHLKV
jgi:hypothetical protein